MTPNRPPASYRHEQADRVNQPTVETSPLLDDETRAPKPFKLSPPPPPQNRQNGGARTPPVVGQAGAHLGP